MIGYRAPRSDIGFALAHVAGLPSLFSLDAFQHLEADSVADIIDEAGRFMEKVVAPTNRVGDLEGVTFDGTQVRVPSSFTAAYERFAEAGWGAIGQPAEYGGAGAPLTLAIAVREMAFSANLALAMCPFLSAGVVALLLTHGTEHQRMTYLPKLSSGEWSGTMDITEPQAGSDVGACTTSAARSPEGGYLINGQKIFISYGDHDLTRQILHLVLARLPDAPAGVKGLSLFLVPKWLDAGCTEPNDITVVGVEHKLGLRGSPTCVLAYGSNGAGAVGELVGVEHEGIRAMFTMMNDARLGVGLQGLAVAEMAYQEAVAYACDREQGQPVGAVAGSHAKIVEHPDVRKTLVTMKASVAAMRAIVYSTAQAMDLASHHPDAAVRAVQQQRADLFTPICKAWCTDVAVQVTSQAIQVVGGMGFVEEFGVAQLYRDVRITPIYEGTNGIQAIDLVMRKVIRDNGAAAEAYLAWAGEIARRLEPVDPELATGLSRGVDVLAKATASLLERRSDQRAVLSAATVYQQLFGLVLGASCLAGGVAHAVAAGEAAEVPLGLLRFYLTHLLPQVHGLLPQILAGDDDLFDLAAVQLHS